MIRTLVILAVVGFVLAVGCFATAFAIVGGPFYIDDQGRFHRTGWHAVSVHRQLVLPPPTHPA